MHPGRIGSADLAELVARRARVDLRLGRESLGRLSGLLAGATGGVPGEPAGDAGSAAATPAAIVAAELGFQPGAEGHPQIRVRVRGRLTLVCQRCLGGLEWPIRLDETLTVVASETEAQALADPFDSVIMPSEGLAPAELVEDEVLASLPLAPMHEADTGAGCRPPAAGGQTEAVSGETHRPFADLKARLRRAGEDRD